MAENYSVYEQVEALNRHDAEGFFAFYAPEAAVQDPMFSDPLRGKEILKDITDFLRAFPDLRFSVRTFLESGNTVAFEGTGEGTHTGPLAGPEGEVAATDRRMKMRFAAFLSLNDQGKIVEERRYYDLAGLMRQLGLTT